MANTLMNSYFVVYVLLILIFCFFSYMCYIISLMIILECLMLTVLFFMAYMMIISGYPVWLFLYALTFAAWEAAMGLCILFPYVKVKGNNMMTMFLMI